MSEYELAFGDAHPIAKKIRKMLGVGDYEAVGCILSQLERTDGRKVTYVPATIEEFDALKKAPDNILKDIGMQQWDEKLWLYPAEWYDYIPDQYEVIKISGKKGKFKFGVTNDEMRYGALAFGFIKEI